MSRKTAFLLMSLAFSAMRLHSQSVTAPGIVPAAANSPVLAGQWHSNLEAAKAKALELGFPLLVLWGTPVCKYCKKLEAELSQPEAESYLAGRGLIMVYEKANADPPTDVKRWVGKGRYPLARLTWSKGGRSIVDHRWERPRSFTEFKSVLESTIGEFVPSSR